MQSAPLRASLPALAHFGLRRSDAYNGLPVCVLPGLFAFLVRPVQTEIEATAREGMVKVVLTGQQTPISVTIAPELLEEGADSVSSAVTDAVKAAHSRSLEYMRERLGGLTSGTLGAERRSLCILLGVRVSCGCCFGRCQGAGHPTVSAVDRCQRLLLERLADSGCCVGRGWRFWSCGGPCLGGLLFSRNGLVAPVPWCRLWIAAAATPVSFSGCAGAHNLLEWQPRAFWGWCVKKIQYHLAASRCPPLYHGLHEHGASS